MGKSFLSGNRIDFLSLRGKTTNADFCEAARDAGEEIPLAVLRRAALVRGRRPNTGRQALKRNREHGTHPSAPKAGRERPGPRPADASTGTEATGGKSKRSRRCMSLVCITARSKEEARWESGGG